MGAHMIQLVTVLIWTALLYILLRTFAAVAPVTYRAFLNKIGLAPSSVG